MPCVDLFTSVLFTKFSCLTSSRWCHCAPESQQCYCHCQNCPVSRIKCRPRTFLKPRMPPSCRRSQNNCSFNVKNRKVSADLRSAETFSTDIHSGDCVGKKWGTKLQNKLSFNKPQSFKSVHVKIDRKTSMRTRLISDFRASRSWSNQWIKYIQDSIFDLLKSRKSYSLKK